MADPEASSQAQFDEATYSLLAGVADPLALASQALAKLTAHGLSGFIGEISEVIARPAETVSPLKNVVSLDLYRHRRDSTDDVPEADHTLEEPGHSARETAVVEGIVEELAEAGLGIVPASPLPRLPERQPQVEEQIRLSPSAQLALIKQAQAGNEFAMDRLCRFTIPLIRKLAGRSLSKLPYDEQVRAGLAAIPGVAERYDPAGGASWYSYAAHRIVGAILDVGRQEMQVSRGTYTRLREIADPKHSVAERRQLIHEWAAHEDETKRFPYATQLIDEDGNLMLQAVGIDGLFRHADESDGGDASPYDALGSTTLDNPHEELVQKLDREELQAQIMRLPERQRIVLTLYYNMLDEVSEVSYGYTRQQDYMTLQEIGEQIGVTESRASQLCTKALENLRTILEGGEIKVQRNNRLQVLNTRLAGENQLLFLERVYPEIAEYESAELSTEEAATIIDVLPPDWSHQNVSLRGNHYNLLKLRLDRPEPALDLSGYRTERRTIGWRGSVLTILTDGMTVSDLRVIMDMQKMLKKSDARPVDQELFSKFTSPKELEIMSDMYTPNKQLALKYRLAESSIRTHWHNAMSRLGIESSAHLAVVLALGGLVPLDTVPAGRTQGLSNRQVEILVDHYEKSYEQGMQVMGVAHSTYRTHWAKIFEKTGTVTQVQAVLMAVKDGLIVEPKPYPAQTNIK